MITSRGVSPLKLLLLSLGILLYFRNDQLITLSQKDKVAEESVQDQQVGEDMKERRELLRRTCSKYGQRLKVPLKLYNKKLRSVVSPGSFSEFNIRIFSRFDLKHRLMYCENYKELLYFSLRFPMIVEYQYQYQVNVIY